MLRFIPLAALILLGAGTQQASAQRRATGQSAPETSQVDVTAQVGAKSYSSSLSGTCKHEPSASIYDLPAALYMVEGQGTEGSKIQQLNLTLWRPKNGSADQVSLSLQVGSSTSRVDVNPRSKAAGQATVQLKPAGSGGTFELKGKDDKGKALSLTIGCATFAGVEAAGG